MTDAALVYRFGRQSYEFLDMGRFRQVLIFAGLLIWEDFCRGQGPDPPDPLDAAPGAAASACASSAARRARSSVFSTLP